MNTTHPSNIQQKGGVIVGNLFSKVIPISDYSLENIKELVDASSNNANLSETLNKLYLFMIIKELHKKSYINTNNYTAFLNGMLLDDGFYTNCGDLYIN